MRLSWIAFATFAASGCNAIVGLDDFTSAPCEGPCADGASETTNVEDSVADSNDDVDVDAADDTAKADVSSDVADAVTDASPDVAPPTCNGAVGATVNVGGYAIDRTEVTNAQYAAFLAAGPKVAVAAACGWKTSFKPAGTWPVDAAHCNRPVANVDWCDAAAYCAWAGKRLCGHPLGGAVPYTGVGFTTAASDQWFNACSSGGANAYPYPGVWVSKFCVDASLTAKVATLDVASVATCAPTVAPFKGVYDLAGNVAEWEDSCDKTTGTMDHCRVRGGSYADDSIHALCAANTAESRNYVGTDVGFRCCSK